MRVFSVSVGLSSLNVYVLAPRYRGHASEDARPGSSPSVHVSTSAPFSFFSIYRILKPRVNHTYSLE